MTKEREEKLISDSSYTAGTLAQFMKEWDALKPTIATKGEVFAVNLKINDHIKNHKDNRTLTPVWIGLLSTAALTIVGFFLKKG